MCKPVSFRRNCIIAPACHDVILSTGSQFHSLCVCVCVQEYTCTHVCVQTCVCILYLCRSLYVHILILILKCFLLLSNIYFCRVYWKKDIKQSFWGLGSLSQRYFQRLKVWLKIWVSILQNHSCHLLQKEAKLVCALIINSSFVCRTS